MKKFWNTFIRCKRDSSVAWEAFLLNLQIEITVGICTTFFKAFLVKKGVRRNLFAQYYF